jgi:cytochrome P450
MAGSSRQARQPASGRGTASSGTLFQALGRRLSSPVPYWRYVRLPADRRVDAAVAQAGALILDRYAEAKRRMINRNEPTDFLTALAKADMDGDDPPNDADVVGNVLTMIAAGEDTTAATTPWVMHFLATHPEVQQQVRAEATDVSAVAAGWRWLAQAARRSRTSPSPTTAPR